MILKNKTSPKTIKRKDAIQKGLKQYYTGKPCIHGHIDFRTTSNGVCMECSRIKALKRMRENPEARKVSRESQKRRYHTDKEFREKVKERSRVWHNANKGRASENKKRWYRENKYEANSKNKERWLKYRECRDWVEKERARKRKEYKDYPERRVASHNARRAREKLAAGRVTAKDILKILKSQKHTCIYCRSSLKNGYEVDHIVPISRGGSNWPSNIQCLCRACNRRKSAKHPFDFAKEMGMLL